MSQKSAYTCSEDLFQQFFHIRSGRVCVSYSIGHLTMWCEPKLTIRVHVGLCARRHWADPLYETYRTRQGYMCTVRVNNREYNTDVPYETEELARNAAATRAYMICRNFSVNDGMVPGQRQGQGGVIQGLPVAIGTGRRPTYSSPHEFEIGSTASGSSSPRSSDCGLDSASRRSSNSSSDGCLCGKSASRCRCTRERRWQ
jgi:hypothetical protein